MRRLLLTVAVLAAGCASAPPNPLQAPPPTIAEVRSEPDGGFRITTNPTGQPLGRSYGVAPDRMWPVAIDAYARVGLDRKSTRLNSSH